WKARVFSPTGVDNGSGTLVWVQRMYAAGAKGFFDALDLHLYDDPDIRDPSWNLWDWAFYNGGSNIRAYMDAQGDSAVPIICTEAGGPVPKYSEANQAAIIDHGFNHLVSGQLGSYGAYS